MLTLCLLAVFNGHMFLKDCSDPSKLYAFKQGHELMIMNRQEAIRVYGIDPDAKAKPMKFIGYQLPADSEDLSK